MKAEILIWYGDNISDFHRTCIWHECYESGSVLHLRLFTKTFDLKIGDMISRSGEDGRIENAIFFGKSEKQKPIVRVIDPEEMDYHGDLIVDLRDELFNMVKILSTDGKKIEQAKAMAGVAQVILNSFKVELEISKLKK